MILLGNEKLISRMQAIDGKKQLLGLLCAVSLSLVLLSGKYVGKKTDFGDAAAMGAATTSMFGARGAFRIHCQPDEVDLCVQGVKARNLTRRGLWLGNSQLHAVNQFRAGERNAPDLLSERLAGKSLDLVTVSLGNGNLQEHLVLFHYLLDRIRPDILILPVVFDDMREDGLRDDVAALTRDERTAQRLKESEIGRKLLEKAPSSAPQPTVHATPQERTEAWLNSWLEQHVPLWWARPEMRGDLFINLYRLRNTVFGITPSSKRKVILGRYASNMMAYETLLQAAMASGVRVLIYVAPIGSDHGERPYVESEYQRFKEDIAALSRLYGTDLENFEDLISEPLWGLKDSTVAGRSAEPDFMHFTAAGHRILAEQIEQRLFAAGLRATERAR
jgi:hypothetical protein